MHTAPTTDPATEPDIAVHVSDDQPDESVPAVIWPTGEDLIRRYAHNLYPHVQIQTCTSSENGSSPQECDICGGHEAAQGEVRLLVHEVLMRSAHARMCKKCVSEKEHLDPEQFRRKVEIALAGRIVAGESE